MGQRSPEDEKIIEESVRSIRSLYSKTAIRTPCWDYMLDYLIASEIHEAQSYWSPPDWFEWIMDNKFPMILDALPLNDIFHISTITRHMHSSLGYPDETSEKAHQLWWMPQSIKALCDILSIVKKTAASLGPQNHIEAESIASWIHDLKTAAHELTCQENSIKLVPEESVCTTGHPYTGCCEYHDSQKAIADSQHNLVATWDSCPYEIEITPNLHKGVTTIKSGTGAVYPLQITDDPTFDDELRGSHRTVPSDTPTAKEVIELMASDAAVTGKAEALSKIDYLRLSETYDTHHIRYQLQQ